MEVTSGEYLRTLKGIIVLVFAQSSGMENFSLKCSKIVKNALCLKKSARTVTHECQKARKVLFTCLTNTKY